ncbi:hypothetical protein L208DRAFT_1394176, partial [Tricholoma matsutake]
MVGPGAIPHCGGALVLILCCHWCLPSSTHPTQPASRCLQWWEWVVARVDSLTSHLKGEEGIGWLWACVAHFHHGRLSP